MMGEGQDKGRAVKIATEIISENINDKVISIGIGDSANDIPMLKCVDIPVLIPHPDGRFEDFDYKESAACRTTRKQRLESDNDRYLKQYYHGVCNYLIHIWKKGE